MNRYWFKPKRYGLGAVPASWEGWAATAVAVLLILAAPQISGRLFATPQAAPLLQTAVAALLIALAWIKTDGGWRWRWGGEG